VEVRLVRRAEKCADSDEGWSGLSGNSRGAGQQCHGGAGSEIAQSLHGRALQIRESSTPPVGIVGDARSQILTHGTELCATVLRYEPTKDSAEGAARLSHLCFGGHRERSVRLKHGQRASASVQRENNRRRNI